MVFIRRLLWFWFHYGLRLAEKSNCKSNWFGVWFCDTQLKTAVYPKRLDNYEESSFRAKIMNTKKWKKIKATL